MTTQIPDHTKTVTWTTGAEIGRDVIRAFHDETHEGGFTWCLEQPCHAIHRLVDEQPGVKL